MKFKLRPTYLSIILMSVCLFSSLNEFFNHHDKIDAIYLILLAIGFTIPDRIEEIIKKEKK